MESKDNNISVCLSSTLMMGSCFSTEVGRLLLAAGCDVTLNPFGILFNPASISDSIVRLERRTPFVEEDVIVRDGQYCSFHHHGSFRRPSPEQFLADANSALEAGASAFERSRTVILTLGTAWIFRHTGRDITVANCHKVPAREFRRERLTTGEIVEMLSAVIARHPDKRWILTVSPVRHKADGLHGNRVSKAILLVACDILAEKFPNVSYFPAYEIMTDELRDWKWYRENGTHPTAEAVSCIFDRFEKFVHLQFGGIR